MKLMMMALVAGSAMAGELTVEPGGLTAEAALDKVRAARAAGDAANWTIRVKGCNALTRPLVFTSADHDLSFVGESGAMFSGGVRLTGWTDTGKGWWEAPAPRSADGKIAYFEQLWVNGRRADRARYPNTGYLKIVKPTVTAAADGKGFVERISFTNGAEQVLAALAQAEMPYAQLGVIHKWSFARRIIRGFDAATGTLEVHSPSKQVAWQVWNERETLVFLENIRAAFDASGEWFYDANAGKVLYRPLPGEKPDTLEAVAPAARISALVKMNGDYRNGKFIRNVSFRNIAFAHTAATRPRAAYTITPKIPIPDYGDGPTESWQYQAAVQCDGAIQMEGVRRVTFDGCSFSHTGNYAMRFSSGCVSNSVVSCRFNDLGAGGVWIGSNLDCRGDGDAIVRKVLRPNRPDSTAFNLVSNCLITAAGRFNPEATGVIVGHCSDTKVVHNDIRDIFYTGVSVGWVWGFAGSVAQRNEIAWNRISDLGKSIMSDMGGVYTLGTSFGTRVHHNEIHDVWSYSYGGWALYCDEGSEGIVMSDNLCWNTTDGGFHQHYGVGCVIRNNVFAFNKELGAVRMQRPEVDGVPCTLNFVNNIVYVDHGPLAGRGVRNVGGIWANNVWYDARGKAAAEFDGDKWDGWAGSGKETGSVFADPLFEDVAAHDFRLKPGSPALKLGFRPIDLSGAGPQDVK